jgi:predicted alpha/beta-hydrolase family hydrolase
MLEVETRHGPARVRLDVVRGARHALVLGHGAGGGIDAPDLRAAAEAAAESGISLALVEQPYRVAGRRSPAPASQLDAGWLEVVARLREHELAGNALVVGGRSLGARVACRTADATDPIGVLCLAFPLRPPGRPNASSRLAELDGVRVPTLVVQGKRDPFGVPPPGANRTIAQVAGDHGLKADLDAVAAAVREWLLFLVGAR